MYDSILIPISGIEAPTKYIHEGIDFANLMKATVHGLYIIDNRNYSAHHESKWPITEAESNNEARVPLSVIETEASEADVQLVTSVKRGVPEEVILDYVREKDVDLILMGTYGRTGFGRVVLGSLSEKLIRNSPVPVHIVPTDRNYR